MRTIAARWDACGAEETKQPVLGRFRQVWLQRSVPSAKLSPGDERRFMLWSLDGPDDRYFGR